MDSDVQAAFSEQDNAIQQLQLQLKESEDRAEERRKEAHEELVKMMSNLMGTRESGGGGGATVGSAGGAVPPDSSAHLDVEGNQDGGESSVAAEADDYYSTARGRQPYPHLKLKVPELTEKEDFGDYTKSFQVYAKLNKFDSVFTTDEYVEVGGSDRDTFIANGGSPVMFDKQLMAWGALSQGLKSSVDRGIFHENGSPRLIWEKLVEWHSPSTNDQKHTLQKKLLEFKMGKNDDPVKKLLGLEQLQAKLESVNMKLNPETIYMCFVHGLPEVEYAQEIRDIGLMDGYDRDTIMRIVRNRYELLQGKKNASYNHHALYNRAVQGTRRGGGSRGRSSRGRGGKRSSEENGNENDNDADSVTCWRCRVKGHLSRDCTIQICERCGGRGHDVKKCPSSVPERKAHSAMFVRLPTADDMTGVTLSEEEAGF